MASMTIQDVKSGPFATQMKNDLSQINEKAEPDSLQTSIINNNSRISKKRIKPPHQRNQDNKEENRDLQNRLEKALNELSEWKDKFWKEKENPIKTYDSGNCLYSPKNRLKTAPYHFNAIYTNNEYASKPATSAISTFSMDYHEYYSYPFAIQSYFAINMN